jgi:hypothetical protein
MTKENIAMADVSSLVDRIDAEINAAKQSVADLQKQWASDFEDRQKRLEAFEQTLGDLQDIWRPRLEALAKRFEGRVEVTPIVEAGWRSATFRFQSEVARIDLRFSVLTDNDVRNVIFEYDLHVVPIFMKFDSRSELKSPLENVDRDAVADWIDERIISFVKTYLAIHQNSYYLKDHLVEDPIAKVRFPKYAAGATLDWQGKTLYFVGEESRQEFERQQSVGAK